MSKTKVLGKVIIGLKMYGLFRVGSGFGGFKVGEVDNPMTKYPDGTPFVSGRTIKGKLRSEIETIYSDKYPVVGESDGDAVNKNIHSIKKHSKAGDVVGCLVCNVFSSCGVSVPRALMKVSDFIGVKGELMVYMSHTKIPRGLEVRNGVPVLVESLAARVEGIRGEIEFIITDVMASQAFGGNHQGLRDIYFLEEILRQLKLLTHVGGNSSSGGSRIERKEVVSLGVFNKDKRREGFKECLGGEVLELNDDGIEKIRKRVEDEFGIK